MRKKKIFNKSFVSILILFTFSVFLFGIFTEKSSGILNAPSFSSNALRRIRFTDIIVGKVLESAGKIVNFLAKQDELPERVDLLMVLGSSDLEVAYKAAELYKQGLAERVLISGGGLIGDKTEAEVFKEILISKGIPEEVILTEDESKNTGQNIENSINVLKANNLSPRSVILLQKPLFQLRSEATLNRQFPEAFETFEKCYSFTPYIPDLSSLSPEEKLQNVTKSLVEIYRFLTWGPDGKDRIVEVTLPPEILEASRIILEELKISKSDVFEDKPTLNELYEMLQEP